MSEHLALIEEAVLQRKRDEIEDLISAALADGLEPLTIINEGLIGAMDTVGEKFASGEFFMPEMLVSAMTMKMGLEQLKPLLKDTESRFKGKIMMMTVKGDLHDVGKNLVTMMLEGAGFDVYDLGVDVGGSQLLKEVKRVQPDIIGLSALLTTTMPEMGKVITAIKEEGLDDSLKVIVGGAPVDQDFATSIHADGYGEDAAVAVKLCKQLIGDSSKS